MVLYMNSQNSESKKKEEERSSEEIGDQHSESQGSEASQLAKDSVDLPPPPAAAAVAEKSPERVDTESTSEAKKEKTAKPSGELTHMITELNRELPRPSTDEPLRSSPVPQAAPEVPQTIKEVQSTTTGVAPSTEVPQIVGTELQQVVIKEVLQVSAEAPQVYTQASDLNIDEKDESAEVSKMLQADPAAQHITTETEMNSNSDVFLQKSEVENQSTEPPEMSTEAQDTEAELKQLSEVCNEVWYKSLILLVGGSVE